MRALETYENFSLIRRDQSLEWFLSKQANMKSKFVTTLNLILQSMIIISLILVEFTDQEFLNP